MSDERLKDWSTKRAHLDAEGIPAFVASGIENGLLFIAEEYKEGARFEKAASASLDLEAAPLLLRQMVMAASAVCIARVMQECVDAGFFHGALNPDRTLRFEKDDAGKPLIFEMGLVQLLDGQAAIAQNPYAAPERKAGEPWNERADIYSMGAIMYEQISGMIPSDNPKKLDAIFPRLMISEIVMQALSPRPEDRFESWTAFEDALKRVIAAFTQHIPSFHESAPDSEDEASSGDAELISEDGAAIREELIPLSWTLQAANTVEALDEAAISSNSSNDNTPSTLRSQGVERKRGALVLVRTSAASIVLFGARRTQDARSPTTLVRRLSDALLLFRKRVAPLAVYGARVVFGGRKAPRHSRRVLGAVAALAVVVLGVTAYGAAQKREAVLRASALDLPIAEIERSMEAALHPAPVAPVQSVEPALVNDAPPVKAAPKKRGPNAGERAKPEAREAERDEPKAHEQSAPKGSAPAPSPEAPKVRDPDSFYLLDETP